MSRAAVVEPLARRYRHNSWANSLVLESLVRSATGSGGSQSPGDPLARNLVSVVVYRNSRGERFERSLHDVLDHVANHGTHHRGQIVLLLRQAGSQLPSPT